MGLQDWMIKKYCYPETPLTDFAESYFPAAIMAKHNVFFKNENYKIMDTYNSNIGIAYHFDAGKFAEWLKIKYAIPRGVKHIVSEVEKIDSSEENIKSITLKNKTNITADLFVDCTGFSSLLLEKTLKEEFIDYSDMLPNNKAWATRIPYKNKEAELDSVTTCTAISNGWVWNIPLWSRLGAGYVYSDKFITKEDRSTSSLGDISTKCILFKSLVRYVLEYD
jgi:tryptophan halogenase